MKTTLPRLSPHEQDWLNAYLDGTIARAEFQSMQDHLAGDPAFRAHARRFLSLDNSLHTLGEEGAQISQSWRSENSPLPAKIPALPRLLPLAAAAGLAFLLGSGLMFWLGKTPPSNPPLASSDESPSATAKGFAVLSGLFNATYPKNSPSRQPGDSLGAETFHLTSGTAEIQFYSGALMTIEGPAEISLKSAWEASCHQGAVRMKVPPAARGFKLHSPSSEIIDLGTEFGLVVNDGEGQVEVFDGEISVRHHDNEEKLLAKGQALNLSRTGPLAPLAHGKISVPNAENFRPQAAQQLTATFFAWQKHRDALARNQRLIAYYTFDQANSSSLIPNLTLPRNPELDGAVILAEPVSGRWPGLKSAFEFRRPGSRIRVNIPGEFPALTFSCWVRIDSLDRHYNALFMSDGYENGEPHWQIRNDGKLMLSVMVDESAPHPTYPKSRFHHVYFSPPVWELSMSGQWLHIASVYDPAKAVVSHFIDGEKVSSETITEDFEVKTLRIGNGEIGNWGQPFRQDPNFTIRNLNGRVDELAIFKTALSNVEVKSLYQKSRPFHR
jgi:hypothetical protein